MNKLFTIKVFLYVLLIALCSCSNPYRTKLKVDIEQTNAGCPVDLGSIGFLESATYDDDANEAVFTYVLTGDNEDNIESLQNTPGLQKQFMGSFLQGDEGSSFLKLLVDAEATLSFVYRGKTNGRTARLTLSYDELKEIADGEKAENNDMHQLENLVAITNAQCPTVIEEGMTMSAVRLEEPYMVFYYELDPEVIELNDDDMPALKDAVKDALREELTDASGLSQLKIMKKCGIGVKYVYAEGVGDSARVAEVMIEPAEVAEF